MESATRLPEVVPVEWLEWTALLAAGAMFLLLIVVMVPGRRADRPERAGRMASRRACRAFADAVVRGDFQEAEMRATHAFWAVDRLGDHMHHGFLRRRFGRIGIREPSVVDWNERIVLAMTVADVRRQFMDPDASAAWFPGIERVPRAGRIDILLGRNEPMRLTLISETWTPGLDELSFTAGCAMFQISGYIGFRTVITGTDRSGAMRTACEVWIHMEGVGTAEGRLALARARTITRDGLNRMAAELSPR